MAGLVHIHKPVVPLSHVIYITECGEWVLRDPYQIPADQVFKVDADPDSSFHSGWDLAE
jgi:hypothetical protein